MDNRPRSRVGTRLKVRWKQQVYDDMFPIVGGRLPGACRRPIDALPAATT